jgi:hypothetical protein
MHNHFVRRTNEMKAAAEKEREREQELSLISDYHHVYGMVDLKFTFPYLAIFVAYQTYIKVFVSIRNRKVYKYFCKSLVHHQQSRDRLNEDRDVDEKHARCLHPASWIDKSILIYVNYAILRHKSQGSTQLRIPSNRTLTRSSVYYFCTFQSNLISYDETFFCQSFS